MLEEAFSGASAAFFVTVFFLALVLALVAVLFFFVARFFVATSALACALSTPLVILLSMFFCDFTYFASSSRFFSASAAALAFLALFSSSIIFKISMIRASSSGSPSRVTLVGYSSSISVFFAVTALAVFFFPSFAFSNWAFNLDTSACNSRIFSSIVSFSNKICFILLLSNIAWLLSFFIFLSIFMANSLANLAPSAAVLAADAASFAFCWARVSSDSNFEAASFFPEDFCCDAIMVIAAAAYHPPYSLRCSESIMACKSAEE
mmetsp:Transcript_12404/g.20340  ORF Transcript_12404/g.20340 Transcript_12404/m.20340 type:complete len:264 (+) Transcript_12404:268-1059(+)